MIRAALLMRLGLLLVTALSSAEALAQGVLNYPSKPVFLVSAYAPGGGTDKDGTVLVQKLTEYFGKPFLMDFRPGAGGVLGTNYVAKAAPDGHTLIIITAAFTVIGATKKNLPYDPLKDFAPVSLQLKRPTMLVVHTSLPVNSFVEYVAYAKANPNKINFATNGQGSLYHIYGAWLHGATNTKVTYVPYKGSGPLAVDIVAGRVDAAPVSFLTGMRWVKAGKLRAIAMMGTGRSSAFPDVRTISEQGIPDYESSAWNGILAPAGVAPPILNRISGEIARWAKEPAVIKQMSTDTGDGTILLGSSPDHFKKYLETELNRWRKLVKDHNIQVED